MIELLIDIIFFIQQYREEADALMAFGTIIGLTQQANALRDPSTTYTRKSSLLNTATYPITLLLPLIAVGLWATFALSLLRFFIWIGIYKYRAPEEEDWLGRKEMTYRELIKQRILIKKLKT